VVGISIIIATTAKPIPPYLSTLSTTVSMVLVSAYIMSISNRVSQLVDIMVLMRSDGCSAIGGDSWCQVVVACSW
jgi:hypothetical protein